MFNPFKKKRDNELLDLSQSKHRKSGEEIPIPTEVRERLKAKTQEIKEEETGVSSQPEPAVQAEKPAETKTGGFFGSFFGGASSAEPKPAIETTTPTATPTPVTSSTTQTIADKIKSIGDRLYKMEQRIELLERKLDIRSRN